MYLGAGRSDITPEPKEVVKPTETGPSYDDVIREVPFPKLSGPEKKIGEIAEDQTAAIRHIAGTLSRMADWQIMHDQNKQFMSDMFYAHVSSIAWYLKWSILVQSASIITACLWFLVR